LLDCAVPPVSVQTLPSSALTSPSAVPSNRNDFRSGPPTIYASDRVNNNVTSNVTATILPTVR
jgi:hypothetical protein